VATNEETSEKKDADGLYPNNGAEPLRVAWELPDCEALQRNWDLHWSGNGRPTKVLAINQSTSNRRAIGGVEKRKRTLLHTLEGPHESEWVS